MFQLLVHFGEFTKWYSLMFVYSGFRAFDVFSLRAFRYSNPSDPLWHG